MNDIIEWYEIDWLSLLLLLLLKNDCKIPIGRDERKKRTKVHMCISYVFGLCAAEEVNGTWCCKFSMCSVSINVHLILYDIGDGDGGNYVTNRLKNCREQISVCLYAVCMRTCVCVCVSQIAVAQQANKRRLSESCHDSWLNCLRLLSCRCIERCLCHPNVLYRQLFISVSSSYAFLFQFDSRLISIFRNLFHDAINKLNNYIMYVYRKLASWVWFSIRMHYFNFWTMMKIRTISSSVSKGFILGF